MAFLLKSSAEQATDTKQEMKSCMRQRERIGTQKKKEDERAAAS
jgi:hypothetical protein